MKSSDYFKEGNNKIGWVGSNFKEYFMNMEFPVPKTIELKTRKLEREMLDREILAEFKPKESNLGELVYALENDIVSKNEYANIFYIRDKNGLLRAVSARWRSDYRYWGVDACSVESPYDWAAGCQVVSRDWNCDK